MSGSKEIVIIILKEQRVYSFKRGADNLAAASIPQIMLPPGSYKAERIKNPLGGYEGSDWLVIEKDQILYGKAEKSWSIAHKKGEVYIKEHPMEEDKKDETHPTEAEGI